VNSLDELDKRPMPFWIDTLSCPTAPEEATDLAITLMRKTYSEADKVLVLDSYLLGGSIENASDAQIALEMLCSGWARRLWTLQEGVLAPKLLVQLSDGVIDFDELHHRLKTVPRWREYTATCQNLDEMRGSWQRKADIVSSGLFVDYASTALRYRATSVPTDEPLCLTTLLGLDMSKVLQEDPENRMKRFWSLVTPPAKIVFRSGQNLNEEGYRWAPASLLSSQKMRTVDEADTSYSDVFANEEPFQTFLEDFEPPSFDPHQQSTPLGHRDQNGLTIKWHGIRLGPWVGHLGVGFFVRNEQGMWYFVGRHLVQSVIDLVPPTSGTKELALIMENPLGELFGNGGRSIDSTIVLVVSISRDENETLFAQIESVGFLVPQMPTDAEVLAVSSLVEFCALNLKHKDLAQEAATGPSTASANAEHFQQVRLGPEDFALHSSVVIPEEEGLYLDARRYHDKIMVLREGEHMFFEGRETAPSQSWCFG
jgi:hypothetical protein